MPAKLTFLPLSNADIRFRKTQGKLKTAQSNNAQYLNSIQSDGVVLQVHAHSLEFGFSLGTRYHQT